LKVKDGIHKSEAWLRGSGSVLSTFSYQPLDPDSDLEPVSDPDSLEMLDPDPMRASITRKKDKVNKVHLLKCWMYS
jgi:hypothetical protein